MRRRGFLTMLGLAPAAAVALRAAPAETPGKRVISDDVSAYIRHASIGEAEITRIHGGSIRAGSIRNGTMKIDLDAKRIEIS